MHDFNIGNHVTQIPSNIGVLVLDFNLNIVILLYLQQKYLP